VLKKGAAWLESGLAAGYNPANISARFVPPFMSSLQRFATLALLVLSLGLPAWAEKADRDKPMNAEADAMRHDDLKQLTVFTGNVVISKGSILIRGGRVEVSQSPDGYQRAQITAAPGQLAYYRSKRDGVDETVEGEAELIEYDGRADTVQFSRRAVLRRLVGSSLADETTGALIRYDNLADVFTVDGAPRNGAAGGRVRAQLSPRTGNAAPASDAAPAVPQPPVVPAPQLRPSSRLGQDKK
jgi:lipopolysaccharide export system protein LptA